MVFNNPIRYSRFLAVFYKEVHYIRRSNEVLLAVAFLCRYLKKELNKQTVQKLYYPPFFQKNEMFYLYGNIYTSLISAW